MSQTERIKRVLRLDRNVYREIRDDPRSMAPALTVMVLSILIGSSRTLIEMRQGGIITLMSLIILWFVPSSFFYVLAKMAGGKSSYTGYLKATGYAQIPMALNVIPEIGWMIAIICWLIYMTVATREAHEFSKRKAVLVVFIPIAVAILIVLSMDTTEAINLRNIWLF
jgi:hypothetical protein